MIAGPRPLSHLKLVQVEVIEPVLADERLSFDKAAIDEVLGLLEALGADGMLTDLVSEQIGLVEFDGFRVDRGPAATARDGQRIDEELPGIVARLASGHLRLARLTIPPGGREGKLPAGEVMGGGAERCLVDG